MTAMRVPVEQLIDLAKLGTPERKPTPREIRDALPRGWVLEEDGVTARSDARLLFKEGWVLIVGLVSFGAAAIGLFYMTLPRGAGGWLRLVLMIVVLIIAGGIVGPIVTRALNRR